MKNNKEKQKIKRSEKVQTAASCLSINISLGGDFAHIYSEHHHYNDYLCLLVFPSSLISELVVLHHPLLPRLCPYNGNRIRAGIVQCTQFFNL